MGIIQVVPTQSGKPEYCLTCHYWQGQVSFLKKSLVHPEINCSECHARHAEWIPRDYQAEPERTDANCLRCHADVQTREITSFKHNVMKIIIPHKFHVEQTGGQCSLCHDSIMLVKLIFSYAHRQILRGKYLNLLALSGINNER